MNPLVKKVVAGLAIKEAFERVQEMREPKKPSFVARVGKAGLFLTAGGGLIYLAKTGRLRPVVDQVKGIVGESNGRPDWQSEGSSPGGSSAGSFSTLGGDASSPATESSTTSEPSGTSSS